MQLCHDDLTEIWRPNISLLFVSFSLSGDDILRNCVFEGVDRLLWLRCPFVQHACAAKSWWFDGDLTSKYLVIKCIIFSVGWWYSTKVCAWTIWQITFNEVYLCSACVCSDNRMILWRSDVRKSRYDLYHFHCRVMIFYETVCLNELTDYFDWSFLVSGMHMQQSHDGLTEIWRPTVLLWLLSFLLSGDDILRKYVIVRVGRLRPLKCPYVQHANAAMPWWFDGDLTSKYLVIKCIIFTVGWWYSTKVCVWTNWQITSTEVSLCSACICSNVMMIWQVSDVQLCCYDFYHFYCRVMIFYESV